MERIYLSSPHMGGNEQKYVQEAFDTNWIAPLGPNVNNFEKELSAYLDVKSASALSSGTAAIHLALIMLGIKQDDEVLVSTFTFSASVNPILYQSARPVFVDSEKDSWNISPELLEKAIKDRIAKGKKPKAIIVVHLYGMPARMDKIMMLSQKYEIPVIEDAAEALGSKYQGISCGSFGEMGILSFNGNKIITSSGGGALVSNDSYFIDESRFLATQARDDAPHYQHSQIGFNYRMSNIVAGIGRGQLEIIDLRVKQRRENFFFYKELFKNVDGIEFLEEPNSDFYSNYWLTTILIDETKTGIDREKIRLALEKDNIETRPLWKPSGSNMTEDDKKRITVAFKKIFNTN